MNKKWSIAEETYLKDNVHRLTDEKLSEKLTHIFSRKVTLTAVRKKRQKLGLKKAQGRGICALQTDSFIHQVYPEI